MNTTEKLIATARNILSELDELGFDEDESIDGGDCVDVVAGLVPELREALAAYDAQQARPWIVRAHTAEPWHVGEMCRGWIEVKARLSTVAQRITSEADARRIVACVNVCAGIPTASIEAGIINLGMDTINALAQQLPPRR